MNDFQQRAEARRARITLKKQRLGDADHEDALRGADAISLVHQLTLTAWAWARKPLPSLERHELPYRFVPGRKM